MDYNAQQQAAITAPLGPMVIVAGPGTGKTATLVGRVQYVIKHLGITPEQILVITFTRKAAAELQQRLARPAVTASTIHALALQLVRQAQPEYAVTDETLEHLIVDCLEIVQEFPAVLQAAQKRWQYICVDEWQDVDAAQAELIELLAVQHGNICVVGDPNQSIYGFRGAKLDVVLQFSEQHPAARQYILTDNYRSQAHILQAATALIAHNQARLDHAVMATRPAQAALTIVQSSSAYAEARMIVEYINSILGASDHLALEHDQGGDTSALQRDYSFGDIAVIYRLNVVGDVLAEALQESGLPFHRIGAVGVFELPAVRRFLEQLPTLTFTAENLSSQLPAELQADAYVDFCTAVAAFDDRPAEAARTALLEYAAIARPEDDWQPGRNAITLLTAHAAKGLEFPLVFIAGVEDGVFPYTLPADCDLEEERRLFYVAMTRAQDRLYITSGSRRAVFGQMEQRPPSRFLAELPAALLKCVVIQPKPRRPQQMRLFEHPSFGLAVAYFFSLRELGWL